MPIRLSKYAARHCIAALIFSVGALGCASTVFARIRWVDKDFDFGLMKEIAGPKTGVSRFINEGPDTIAILEVRPSCGCTSVEFSDAPIAPGDTASFSYTYDPTMRPGKFLKTVKLHLSDGSRPSVKISGNVLGTPESLASLYPVEAGPIRLSDSILSLGEVSFGRSPMTFVNAYSTSLDSISPRVSAANPGVIISASSPLAGPGDIITYSINFDSRKIGQYGPVVIPISFSAPDAVPATVELRAFVIPDPERLELLQKGKNPACEVAPDPIDLGQALQGKISASFQIRNAGSSPLEILSISTESDAFKFGKLPKPIKPGKTATIKIEIDANLLPGGPFRLPVKIVSNDPLHPLISLPVCCIKVP